MPARTHPPIAIFLVGVLGIALFSGMDAVMKGLVLAIGTLATMFWRNLIGVFLSGAIYLPRRVQWPTREAMRVHVARGLLSTVMGLLFFWGLGRVPLAQAIALAFIAPLIALYLAAVLLHEEVSRRIVTASLIAFGGVVVIFIGQARADLGHDATIGSIAILASAVCYALNIVIMRHQALIALPKEITFFQSVIVTILLGAAVPFVGVPWPGAGEWMWLTLAAGLAITSMLLLSWAYARAEASYLATTEYTSFLWSSLFGWLVFSEPLSPATLAGATLIVAGCLYASRRPASSTPEAVELGA
jgi:S-adenosylmethionine uptake transporter